MFAAVKRCLLQFTEVCSFSLKVSPVCDYLLLLINVSCLIQIFGALCGVNGVDARTMLSSAVIY